MTAVDQGRRQIAATTAFDAPAALLLIADALAVLASIVRFGRVTPNTILLVTLSLGLIAAGGHYRSRLQFSLLDDMTSLSGRVVVAISLAAAYRELVSGHDVFTADRLWVLLGAVGLLLTARAIAYMVIRQLRLLGILQQRTVVIGSSKTQLDVGEAIAMNPESGLRLVGHACDWPADPSELDADVVISEGFDGVATTGPRRDVYLLPSEQMRYPAVAAGIDYLWSIPLIRLRSATTGSIRWRLKRMFDLVGGAALLVLSLPVLAVCAFVLRIEGGAGVIFRQERIGFQGRPFTMLKLRTVTRTVDDDPNVSWRPDSNGLSPFARFCRATSFDELPQLWNVIRGEMSLVGPRPERPHFVAQFSQSIPNYDRRHRMPVGLTGLAQVHGLRGDTSIRERAHLDNSYIDNWSLDQDLKILARTVSSTLSRRGRGS